MLLVNRTLAFLVPTFVPGSGPFLLLRRGARPLCDEGPGGEERASQVAQLCPALCDLMDCCPPGSSVHGILQARMLEWVVMLSSRGSSQPRDRTRGSEVSCRRVLYHSRHLGSPGGEQTWAPSLSSAASSPTPVSHQVLDFFVSYGLPCSINCCCYFSTGIENKNC